MPQVWTEKDLNEGTSDQRQGVSLAVALWQKCFDGPLIALTKYFLGVTIATVKYT
jgi:hypothetical protein